VNFRFWHLADRFGARSRYERGVEVGTFVESVQFPQKWLQKQPQFKGRYLH